MAEGLGAKACAAYFTPSLAEAMPCGGVVHSVFDHAANLAVEGKGRTRLVTLLPLGAPPVPDGVHVSRRVLAGLRVHMPVLLESNVLCMDGSAVPLMEKGCGELLLSLQPGRPRLEEFLELEAWRGSGFGLLPGAVREQAEAALIHGGAQRWIGLGPGLTPSFDDACVGAMAVYRAAGRAHPFGGLEVSATTDVSARYLTLAMEGYFSRRVVDVVHALYNRKKDLRKSADALACLGKTSGRDVLLGMRGALQALA